MIIPQATVSCEGKKWVCSDINKQDEIIWEDLGATEPATHTHFPHYISSPEEILFNLLLQ